MRASGASLLVANEASDAEIAQAIAREDLAGHIAIAFQAATADSAPPDPESVFALVTRFVALVGGDWGMVQREEFIDQASAEFVEMPSALVLDALARARRFVNMGRNLVQWVSADVDSRRPRLARDVETLTRLMTLVG